MKLKKKETTATQKVYLLTDKLSFSSQEAYRSLRTNVMFALPGNECKCIGVTSPTPSDGKSTTAANLAISLGQIVPLPDGHYAPSDLPLLSREEFVSLVRAFGSQRILFGTDSPWANQQAYVDRLQAMPLTEAEKENILWRNAKGLLELKADS